ncbi:sensor histidine kinase [Agaribacter flavus]|uniref:Sensor histidine kinase n=1 Tax=Agaribacter flavus TaxID=1902781 RepID=A0ABV7FSU8_9ALTE
MKYQMLVGSKYQFYLVNLAGWAGYISSRLLGTIYWDKTASYYWFITFGGIFAFLLSFSLRPIYLKIWAWEANTAKKIILVLGICYLLSIIWVVPMNLLFWDIFKQGYRPGGWYGYISDNGGKFYLYFCWSCLYFGIKFYREMQKATQSALKANSLAHEAQLKMLRYQLNPHFLFNTLNAISTLILIKQNDRANEMVARLSNFLRDSLDNDPMQKVTLKQEINTLQLYLGIEKVRFDERLEVKFDIGKNAEEALIPSLILQPLVENSIKYAIANSETGGTIKICANIERRYLLLLIEDNGPGVKLNGGSLPSGRGVGIKNTQGRLKELYGEEHTFSITNAQPSGLRIAIQIPYEVSQ